MNVWLFRMSRRSIIYLGYNSHSFTEIMGYKVSKLASSLLLLLLLSSSSSPLYRVFILIFLRQTMSLGNSVAAILFLLFMVLISLVSVLDLLYFHISTFRLMCAVPDMAVFWSSLTSCFPGMLLTYFLNDFEIVPVAPIIIIIIIIIIILFGSSTSS